MSSTVLSLPSRVGAVWYRHFRVYTKSFLSNALPPFVEPLIFLGGIGLGLGVFIPTMGGLPYVTFLATGLLVTVAMFTAAFEMSYDCFVRLNFDKVYDGMLGAPLTAYDLTLGEILWCGTKGAFFTTSVLIICTIVGALPPGPVFFAPAVGFLTGIVFACMALLITTLVDSINNFSFFFSGIISPMFFFCGVVFPLSNLPKVLQPLAEILPLTHPVRLSRGLIQGMTLVNLWDIGYIVVFCLLVGWLGMRRFKRILVV